MALHRNRKRCTGFCEKYNRNSNCDDHDPLDILVICSIDVFPMCIVEAKVIGAMEMVDGEERDDKIIAVAGNDMSVNYINDLSELPPHTLVELKIQTGCYSLTKT